MIILLISYLSVQKKIPDVIAKGGIEELICDYELCEIITEQKQIEQ